MSGHFDQQLLKYIRFGRNDEIKTKLNHDLIKVFDEKGTLLHYAVEYNNEEITRCLLEMGLDINFLSSNCKTPLMIAVEKRSTSAVEVLLNANANIELVDAEGKSALHLLFATELFEPEIFQHFHKRFQRDSLTNEEIVEKLFKAGSSMYHAVHSRNIEVMQGLLDRGIDVNSKGCIHKMTALHVAVHFNDLKIVKWLLVNNADVNALNRNGRSPLYDAASRGNVNLVRLLLGNGANPNPINTFDGTTPLYAVFASYADISNNSDVDDEDKWNKCVELLLRNGAIPQDPIDWRMPTLFDNAMMHMKSKRLKYLICHLALIDERDRSFKKSVILHYNDVIYEAHMDETVKYYRQCQKILRFACHGLTLFDLLTASDSEMKVYVRNETFLPALWVFIFGLTVSKNFSFYSDMLKDRIRKITDVVKLENSAIPVLCELLNFHYNLCYIIARKIIGYLDEHDLRQLTQVCTTSVSVMKSKGEAKGFVKYLNIKSIRRLLYKR